MIHQMCVFRWSPMIHLGFLGGFVFACLSFVFSLNPKTNKDFWATFFVCVCSAVSLKHPPPKVPKTLKTWFFYLSLFGRFFLFLFKIKHHTKSKEAKREKNKKHQKVKHKQHHKQKQRVSLQKSQSVGLLSLQSWTVSNTK